MNEILIFLLMLVLLLVKGFFSGSEIALVSADRIRLRHQAAQGNSGAGLALRLLRDPARLLTTTLLGTNMSSIALTTVGTLLMIRFFGGEGELVALLVFTPLFLVLGEIVPKSIYQQKANVMTQWIAYPLGWLQTVLSPLVLLFSYVAKMAAWVIGGRADDASAARDQLLASVQMAEQAGAAAAFSRGQVRRLLRFAQMTAAEAMWPISDVRGVDRKADMKTLVALRRETGQRLIPLYDDSPVNVSGVAIIESWDLLDPGIAERRVADFQGPVRFVPQFQRVSEVIEFLHDVPELTVVVVDEFGNALGLITLNLLVRETLGAQTSPLTDRRPAEQLQRIRSQEDGSYLIDARAPIAEVNDRLDLSLSTLDHSTIGGYALSRFGRLPAVGDTVTVERYRFAVVEADERHIVSLSAISVDPANE